ncbi:MAG: hypothetical protein IAE91_08520 [Ignavibacteriaceae bacterium]|nr:hypothetical protein [Ignavibacteriaceae bacterium]
MNIRFFDRQHIKVKILQGILLFSFIHLLFVAAYIPEKPVMTKECLLTFIETEVKTESTDSCCESESIKQVVIEFQIPMCCTNMATSKEEQTLAECYCIKLKSISPEYLNTVQTQQLTPTIEKANELVFVQIPLNSKCLENFSIKPKKSPPIHLLNSVFII